MDTAVLVAIVAFISALVTKMVDWWRGRGQDAANTARTYVESSTDIVDNFRALLDETKDQFKTQVEGLESRVKRLEDELADERSARKAAEARADEVRAELAVSRRMHDESEQYVEVLVSTLVHHGIEVPIRPTTFKGDTP